MKRNMGLVKVILEYAEANGSIVEPGIPDIEGYASLQVDEHIRLSRDVGYLDGRGRLTWKGHDALDDFRVEDSASDGFHVEGVD